MPGARGQVREARRDDADCLSNLAEAAAGSMDRTLPSHSGLPTWHGVAVWVLFLGHALRAFEFLGRQRTGSPGCDDACAARVMLACRSPSSRTHPAFDASCSDGHLNTAVAGMPSQRVSCSAHDFGRCHPDAQGRRTRRNLTRPFPTATIAADPTMLTTFRCHPSLVGFPRVAPVA